MRVDSLLISNVSSSEYDAGGTIFAANNPIFRAKTGEGGMRRET